MNNWIESILSWKNLSFNNRHFEKELLFDLINSKDEKSATKAYWKLEEEVCFNGVLAESAIDVTIYILSTFHSCSYSSQLKCLELLGQIVVAEPEIPVSSVLEDCISEILGFSWWILQSIEKGEPKDVWLYVDLIGVLALRDEKIRHKAIVFLKKSLNRIGVPERDLLMIENTLNEIINIQRHPSS